MPAPGFDTRCYDLHGHPLAIRADDPRLLAALHARLRYFHVPTSPPAALHFTVSSVPTPEHHRVERPTQPARSIYEPPHGEVLYVDQLDELYIDTEQVRARARLTAGRAELSAVAGERALWLLSHPLFTLPLVEMLKRRGLFSLHAAALTLEGRTLLLPGTTGAGKSTLALALIRAGWCFMGDDTLFLRRAGGSVQVLAFPDEIDVTQQTLALFPELASAPSLPRLPGAAKWQLRAERLYRTLIVREAQPTLLLFPRVGRQASSEIVPMPPNEALLELLPNVLLTQPRLSQAHLDLLGELAQRLPAYRLRTGRDLAALPVRLAALLQRASA